MVPSQQKAVPGNQSAESGTWYPVSRKRYVEDLSLPRYTTGSWRQHFSTHDGYMHEYLGGGGGGGRRPTDLTVTSPNVYNHYRDYQ
ncbi:hypothetical protein BaRGS_00006252 [Batillaria attramentaria]|uniref:Uncharacterized protein n=1 Tax=Batillaria attramentaria TaxID=370345 RepID=A0ABD0LTG1_9CAEN